MYGIFRYFEESFRLDGYTQVALEVRLCEFISHALRHRRVMSWIHRPQLVVHRHFGRYGEHYTEEMVKLPFEYSRSRRCRLVHPLVCSQLNGNNGSWTNTDDLAAHVGGGGHGRGGNAAVNAANLQRAGHQRPGQARAARPALPILPPNAICAECSEVLVPPAAGNPLLNPRQGFHWNCGCWTCTECFAVRLNEKIIDLGHIVSTVSCSVHSDVSSCKVSKVLDHVNNIHILPPNTVPFWLTHAFLAPPVPLAVARQRAPWMPVAVDLYYGAPVAAQSRITVEQGVAGAGIGGLVGYFEPTLLGVGLLVYGGYLGYLWVRKQCMEYGTVSPEADMLGIDVNDPDVQEINSARHRDNLMVQLGYRWIARRHIYPLLARETLIELFSNEVHERSLRQVEHLLAERVRKYQADVNVLVDLDIVGNTAIYIVQTMQLKKARGARAILHSSLPVLGRSSY